MSDAMKKVYLYTTSHYGSSGFIDHGQIHIDDNNFVNGKTPVEDFGMFFYGPTPFEGDIKQAFYDLLFEHENTPKNCWGGTNHEYKPEWNLSDTPIGKYLNITCTTS